ncbi:MAG: hypothetical protein GXW96_04120 [Christensenellaceae bacterium]|nr:hypothetical protein [Christensenellaceae bacterium]
MRFKLLLFVVMIPFLLSGCFYWDYAFRDKEEEKVYEYETNETDGVAVIVDGVKYVVLPETKWEGQKIGKRRLGYAGVNPGKPLYLAEGDENRNFLFIYDSALCPEGDTHQLLMHREDLPEPSADIVDRVHWVEYKSSGGKVVYSRSNTITDKEVIKELFHVWENQTRVPDALFFDKGSDLIIMYIDFYSSKVPGVYRKLDIKHCEGAFMMGRNLEGYVEILPQLLEKVSGCEMDIEKYLAED